MAETVPGCEFFVPVAESNAEMCDKPAAGYVGVDFTPYCDLHIDFMREKEARST